MSPEMEIPGRLLFSVAAAEAVPVLELAGGATPEEDSLLATTECRSLASALVPVPFSMLTCGKFCPAFEELALAGFSLVISGVVVATVVAALDGPMTNLEASSAPGITGAGSGGTWTALMITAAFCAFTSGPMVSANTGTVGSETALVSRSTGLTGASNNFGLSLAGTGIRSEERRVGKECRSRWSPYH